MIKKAFSWILKRVNNFFYLLLRLVNYYPHFEYLHGRGSRLDLTKDYELEFTPQEKAFLKVCASTYNFFESDYSLGHRQRPLSVFKLKDVTFFANTGIVLLKHKLIVESGMSVDRLTQTKAYRDFSVLIPSNYTTGIYTTVLHSHWADNNISHWFFDCLPRLYILTQLVHEPITLLMWSGAHSYQKQTIDFLLKSYPNIKIKYISKYRKIKISNFYLPSFIQNSYSGYIPPEVCLWLRENLWESFKVIPTNSKSRLYISRSKAKSRRVTNENELMPLLKAFNFEIVKPEDLEYHEQAQLFFNAETVVAPHGAGLTNVLFSKECDVLELHPAKIMKAHYFLLCKSLNFAYTPIIGSSGDENEDFSVNIAEVKEWLLKRYGTTYNIHHNSSNNLNK